MHTIQWHKKQLKYLLGLIDTYKLQVKGRHGTLIRDARLAQQSKVRSASLPTLYRCCNALTYVIIKTLLQDYLSIEEAREVKSIRKELKEHPVADLKRNSNPKTLPVYTKVLPRRILTEQ